MNSNVKLSDEQVEQIKEYFKSNKPNNVDGKLFFGSGDDAINYHTVYGIRAGHRKTIRLTGLAKMMKLSMVIPNSYQLEKISTMQRLAKQIAKSLNI